MKKNILFLFSLFCIFCFSNSGFAQSPKSISSVKQKDKTIEFTVSSDKPFYTGDNIYVLSIGSVNFSLFKQTKSDGKGFITFLIPQADFDKLIEGEGVFLTYGEQTRAGSSQQQDLEELSKTSKTCWSL